MLTSLSLSLSHSVSPLRHSFSWLQNTTTITKHDEKKHALIHFHWIIGNSSESVVVAHRWSHLNIQQLYRGFVWVPPFDPLSLSLTRLKPVSLLSFESNSKQQSVFFFPKRIFSVWTFKKGFQNQGVPSSPNRFSIKKKLNQNDLPLFLIDCKTVWHQCENVRPGKCSAVNIDAAIRLTFAGNGNLIVSRMIIVEQRIRVERSVSGVNCDFLVLDQ